MLAQTTHALRRVDRGSSLTGDAAVGVEAVRIRHSGRVFVTSESFWQGLRDTVARPIVS